MLQTLDIFIVGIFFVVVFLVGVIDRKKVNLEAYWVNNRKTNKFTLVATSLSTYIGAASILTSAAVAYAGGGFILFAVAGSFFIYMLIFAKFFSPKIKEFGDNTHAYTIPDFFATRYSNKVRVAAAFVNLASLALFLGLQMLGMGLFISAVGGINPTLGTLIGGLIVISYTAIGGMRADIRTDIFQFFIMLSLLLIFLPLLILKGGGFAALSTLSSSFFFGTEFAPFYVMILIFLFLGAGNLVSPDLWQRAYAADTVKNAKWAMNITGILIFIFLSMAIFFGIYGKILLPEVGSNMVVPELLKLILPTGLSGLVLAGFFAAIMSTADSVLLLTSMTIVHDLYQKSRKKSLPGEVVLKISRFVTFLIGIAALTAALIVFNVIHLAFEATSFFVALLPSVVFGFYWKKATSQAAFWSIILGTLTVLVFLFIDPIQAFIPGLFVSFIAFIIVQFMTRNLVRS